MWLSKVYMFIIFAALSSPGRWQKWLCGRRPSGSGSGYEGFYWISSLCEEGMTDWFWNKTSQVHPLEPWLFLILSFAAAWHQRGRVGSGVHHRSSFGGSQQGDGEGGHTVVNRVSSRIPVSAYIHVINSQKLLFIYWISLCCTFFVFFIFSSLAGPMLLVNVYYMKHYTQDWGWRIWTSKKSVILDTTVTPQSRFIHFTERSSLLSRFLCTSRSVKISQWSSWVTGRRSQAMCVL